MRLTTPRSRNPPSIDSEARRWRGGVLALVAGLMAVTFAVDLKTGAAPYQHLYYAPIIAAGIGLPGYAGAFVAWVAVVLYHLANPSLLTFGYRESDVVQIALFLAIGIVTARLADDSRRFRRLSVTDDLTGLYNLRGFDARLTAMILGEHRVFAGR